MENEVLKALNTLKRADQIESVLFWKLKGRNENWVYLPNYRRVNVVYDSYNDMWEVKCWVVAGASKDHKEAWWVKEKERAMQFLNQWKMAKLAVAFL